MNNCDAGPNLSSFLKMSTLRLVLPSDGDIATYPGNTISDFRTAFNPAIQLNGDTELGLAEISFPKTLYVLEESDVDSGLILLGPNLPILLRNHDLIYNTKEMEHSPGQFERINFLAAVQEALVVAFKGSESRVLRTVKDQLSDLLSTVQKQLSPITTDLNILKKAKNQLYEDLLRSLGELTASVGTVKSSLGDAMSKVEASTTGERNLAKGIQALTRLMRGGVKDLTSRQTHLESILKMTDISSGKDILTTLGVQQFVPPSEEHIELRKLLAKHRKTVYDYAAQNTTSRNTMHRMTNFLDVIRRMHVDLKAITRVPDSALQEISLYTDLTSFLYETTGLIIDLSPRIIPSNFKSKATPLHVLYPIPEEEEEEEELDPNPATAPVVGRIRRSLPSEYNFTSVSQAKAKVKAVQSTPRLEDSEMPLAKSPVVYSTPVIIQEQDIRFTVDNVSSDINAVLVYMNLRLGFNLFAFDPLRQRVIISPQSIITGLRLKSRVASLLGFEADMLYEMNQYHIAPYAVDLTGGVDYVCLYCPEIEGERVSGKRLPLVRFIPFKADHLGGRYQHEIYPFPYFCRLSVNQMSSIQLIMRDQMSRPILFKTGIAIVTVQLRMSR